ncbi:hypothetical protein [Lyngbya sp. CCY1209]|uniref:hypothetical protein n=1 Tax=Lyngbya sp. CCY1209 TaxID=2886103 RepID=UPI002D20E9BB|nr:hypothetical protein [Lyngbya sp. CCY1209]MEB3884028.1 hypothetical protein [Lyngbya sp. CCY1209]
MSAETERTQSQLTFAERMELEERQRTERLTAAVSPVLTHLAELYGCTWTSELSERSHWLVAKAHIDGTDCELRFEVDGRKRRVVCQWYGSFITLPVVRYDNIQSGGRTVEVVSQFTDHYSPATETVRFWSYRRRDDEGPQKTATYAIGRDPLSVAKQIQRMVDGCIEDKRAMTVKIQAARQQKIASNEATVERAGYADGLYLVETSDTQYCGVPKLELAWRFPRDCPWRCDLDFNYYGTEATLKLTVPTRAFRDIVSAIATLFETDRGNR